MAKQEKEFFPITSVSRDDLEERGFDTPKFLSLSVHVDILAGLQRFETDAALLFNPLAELAATNSLSHSRFQNVHLLVVLVMEYVKLPAMLLYLGVQQVRHPIAFFRIHNRIIFDRF